MKLAVDKELKPDRYTALDGFVERQVDRQASIATEAATDGPEPSAATPRGGVAAVPRVDGQTLKIPFIPTMSRATWRRCKINRR